MRQYELYLVIDAEVEEEDVNAIVEKMTELVEYFKLRGDETMKAEAKVVADVKGKSEPRAIPHDSKGVLPRPDKPGGAADDGEWEEF